MKLRLIISLAAVSLLLQACTLPWDTQKSGNVLYKDDFSNATSGWDRVEETDRATDYVAGVYRILVKGKNIDVWARPGLSFGDVRVEVEGTKAGGDDNNDFGVICRYQDDQNFYFLVISSDGYYGIAKRKEGQVSLLGNTVMVSSDQIKQGAATNHLRADCVGTTLRLFINEVMVFETQDADYHQGDVGLLAGSFDNPGTEILFDNFAVLKP
ncbi:MAG TPA: hypothetical protein VIV15_12400 [Anaerolineales bacterium]